MRFVTPEISWHSQMPLMAIDFQPVASLSSAAAVPDNDQPATVDAVQQNIDQIMEIDSLPATQTFRFATSNRAEMHTMGSAFEVNIWCYNPEKPLGKEQIQFRSQIESCFDTHVTALRFAPSGDDRIAVGENCGDLSIFRLDPERLQAEEQKRFQAKMAVLHGPAGQDDDTSASHVTVDETELVRRMYREWWTQVSKVTNGGEIRDLSWSSDGRLLACALADIPFKCVVYDTKDKKERDTLPFSKVVAGVKFDVFDRFLVVVPCDATVRIYKKAKPKHAKFQCVRNIRLAPAYPASAAVVAEKDKLLSAQDPDDAAGVLTVVSDEDSSQKTSVNASQQPMDGIATVVANYGEDSVQEITDVAGSEKSSMQLSRDESSVEKAGSKASGDSPSVEESVDRQPDGTESSKSPVDDTAQTPTTNSFASDAVKKDQFASNNETTPSKPPSTKATGKITEYCQRQVYETLFLSDFAAVFRRRPDISPDGKFMIVPGGIALHSRIAATHLFRINGPDERLLFSYPSPDPSLIARFCPRLFALRPDTKPLVKDLNYRVIFAVCTEKTVFVYDLQQREPIGVLETPHYLELTDMSWSPDGRSLWIASLDGYVSILTLDRSDVPGGYFTDPIHCTPAFEAEVIVKTVGNSLKMQVGAVKDKKRVHIAGDKQLTPEGRRAAMHTRRMLRIGEHAEDGNGDDDEDASAAEGGRPRRKCAKPQKFGDEFFEDMCSEKFHDIRKFFPKSADVMAAAMQRATQQQLQDQQEQLKQHDAAKDAEMVEITSVSSSKTTIVHSVPESSSESDVVMEAAKQKDGPATTNDVDDDEADDKSSQQSTRGRRRKKPSESLSQKSTPSSKKRNAQQNSQTNSDATDFADADSKVKTSAKRRIKTNLLSKNDGTPKRSATDAHGSRSPRTTRAATKKHSSNAEKMAAEDDSESNDVKIIE